MEYRIYDDRVELDTHFGVMTVPFAVIESVAARPSDVKQLFALADLQLKNFRPALKLDWANFQDHIVVDKSAGWVRRILSKPDDVSRFTSELDCAVTEFKAGTG